MVVFKELRGAFSKEEGEYITQRVRGGVVERPYKLGNKVVWAGDARAARIKEEIEAINKIEKASSGKRATKERAKARKEGRKVPTKAEIHKTTVKLTQKVKNKYTKENYVTTTRDYLARMPAIVEGMRGYLSGDEGARQAINKFFN